MQYEYLLTAGRPGKLPCAVAVRDHPGVDDSPSESFIFSKQVMFSHSRLHFAAIARSMKPLCGSRLRKCPNFLGSNHPLPTARCDNLLVYLVQTSTNAPVFYRSGRR